MDGDIDLNRVPLTRLSEEAKNLLSSLLNTKKVLKNVCSDRVARYRDWRGIASLVDISAQLEVSINEYPDKFGRLLEIWRGKDSDATIGQLLEYLQLLDRHDVHDDLIDLSRQNKLIAPPSQELVRIGSPQDDLITFQDVQFNSPQIYHAYVLYAQQDRDFVEYMLQFLRDRGLKLCTDDDLLPGFSTRFEPVARLISQRCIRIILIYSPDFFASNAVKFLTHFAQAHGVESNILNLCPIMYRYCTLPPLLAHYHYLSFRGDPYSDAHFWTRLERALSQGDVRRLRNGITASSEHSGPRIVAISSNTNGSLPCRAESSTPRVESVQDVSQSRFTPQEKELLQLPEIPKANSSYSIPESIRSTQSESSNEAQGSKSMEKKQKKNKVEKFFINVLSIGSKVGKKKKAIMVEN